MKILGEADVSAYVRASTAESPLTSADWRHSAWVSTTADPSLNSLNRRNKVPITRVPAARASGATGAVLEPSKYLGVTRDVEPGVPTQYGGDPPASAKAVRVRTSAKNKIADIYIGQFTQKICMYIFIM